MSQRTASAPIVKRFRVLWHLRATATLPADYQRLRLCVGYRGKRTRQRRSVPVDQWVDSQDAGSEEVRSEDAIGSKPACAVIPAVAAHRSARPANWSIRILRWTVAQDSVGSGATNPWRLNNSSLEIFTIFVRSGLACA